MEFRIVKLIDISNPKQWKNLPSSELTNEGYDVYGANGIIGKYTEYNHEYPTLAITCRGATCGNLHITKPKSYINSNAMALDNLNEDVNIKYLYYALNSRGFNDIITGSAQPQITREGLSNIKIPLPRLQEQIHIAEILTHAENLITRRKESIDLLDELLKSTFLEMFGDPVRNEKGWKKMNISQIGKDEKRAIKSGPFGSQLLISELLSKGIPVYGIDNVQKNKFVEAKPKFISEEKFNDLIAFKIESEDVLITRTGTVGRTCLAPKNIDKCIIGPNLLKITLNQDIALPVFISSAFNYCRSIIDKIKELSPGATVAVFNTTNLKALKFGIPPVELQKQYLLLFNKVLSLIKEYEASLIELENLYGVLRQKAFKGELNLSKVNLELYKEEIKTPVAGSLEHPKETENLPVFPKKDIYIKDMTLDEYYGIPEDIIAKYGSIENHHEDWEFMLKKIFHDSPIDLSKLEEIYNKITYDRGGYFVFEDWKAFIFNELSKSKSFLKQKYNSETNQLELLINEIKKS